MQGTTTITSYIFVYHLLDVVGHEVHHHNTKVAGSSPRQCVINFIRHNEIHDRDFYFVWVRTLGDRGSCRNKAVVSPMLSHELFMCALLNHYALGDDCDDISILYGREPVRDDDAGPTSPCMV